MSFQLGPIQEKWLTFLEENPTLQGTHILGRIHRKSDGSLDTGTHMCCLGAGKFVLNDCKLPEGEITDHSQTSRGVGILAASYSQLGLQDSLGSITAKSNPVRLPKPNPDPDYGFEVFYCLVDLNDAKVPWQKIAQIIRDQPERFFVESK